MLFGFFFFSMFSILYWSYFQLVCHKQIYDELINKNHNWKLDLPWFSIENHICLAYYFRAFMLDEWEVRSYGIIPSLHSLWLTWDVQQASSNDFHPISTWSNISTCKASKIVKLWVPCLGECIMMSSWTHPLEGENTSSHFVVYKLFLGKLLWLENGIKYYTNVAN